jgi:uncharacterized protein (DUF433 family)
MVLQLAALAWPGAVATRKAQVVNSTLSGVTRRSLARNGIAVQYRLASQPTFRETRILVADVLEQVSSGMAWESIGLEWRELISKDAIAEAVRLASQAFKYVLQPLR